MSASGLPSTAIMSASRPLAIAPNWLSRCNSLAASIVADWIACIGVMP
jgi:hypothetical protein